MIVMSVNRSHIFRANPNFSAFPIHQPDTTTITEASIRRKMINIDIRTTTQILHHFGDTNSSNLPYLASQLTRQTRYGGPTRQISSRSKVSVGSVERDGGVGICLSSDSPVAAIVAFGTGAPTYPSIKLVSVRRVEHR
jgi:hypothetical protein